MTRTLPPPVISEGGNVVGRFRLPPPQTGPLLRWKFTKRNRYPRPDHGLFHGYHYFNLIEDPQFYDSMEDFNRHFQLAEEAAEEVPFSLLLVQLADRRNLYHAHKGRIIQRQTQPCQSLPGYNEFRIGQRLYADFMRHIEVHIPLPVNQVDPNRIHLTMRNLENYQRETVPYFLSADNMEAVDEHHSKITFSLLHHQVMSCFQGFQVLIPQEYQLSHVQWEGVMTDPKYLNDEGYLQGVLYLPTLHRFLLYNQMWSEWVTEDEIGWNPQDSSIEIGLPIDPW